MSFNESEYLQLYPDVSIAVNRGLFKNGLDHYEKYGKEEGRNICICVINKETKSKYIDVPFIFRPTAPFEYPKGNNLWFEEYFYNEFQKHKPNTFRVYLPIFWSNIYCAEDDGKSISMQQLYDYLNTLDKSLKYFTICQYDDGLMFEPSDFGLDILVYASGKYQNGYYPIPLLSNNSYSNSENKDILYSFNGRDTHKLRNEMVKLLNSEYVSFYCFDTINYNNILSRTKFALCPRGYGESSFRLSEAMSFGCVPVYISDNFIEPFNIPFEYGVKIKPNDIENLHNILSTIEPKFYELQDRCKEIFEKYYTYQSCYDTIIKTLTYD